MGSPQSICTCRGDCHIGLGLCKTGTRCFAPPAMADSDLWLQAASLKKLAAEAKAVLDGFWGTDRRQMLCTALIDRFLPLSVMLICIHISTPTDPRYASMLQSLNLHILHIGHLAHQHATISI